MSPGVQVPPGPPELPVLRPNSAQWNDFWPYIADVAAALGALHGAVKVRESERVCVCVCVCVCV